MQWAISKSHVEIGEHGERLPIKEMQGLGDKRISAQSGEAERVGAGGWGGGVNLAKSDIDTQRRNNEKFKRMLRKIHNDERDEEDDRPTH